MAALHELNSAANAANAAETVAPQAIFWEASPLLRLIASNVVAGVL